MNSLAGTALEKGRRLPIVSRVMPETPSLLPPTREEIERLADEAFLTISAAFCRALSPYGL
jgi:hypothetical protein